MKTTTKIFIAIGVLALLLTLVSLIPSDFWMIRSLDFVRELATYGFVALMIAGLIFARERAGMVAALFGTAALINTACIWPYSALAPTEIDLVANPSKGKCFTAMSVNVLMESRDYAGVMEQVRKVDPDILLLTETDREWIEKVKPLISQYPYVRTHPLENAYGKVFASRLDVVATSVADEAGDEAPTLYALLRASDASLIRYIGLHPKPPVPGRNTDKRDESIMDAADEVYGDIAGGLVMGDFNDVPWSGTTSQFREEGDWRDPRIGRGTYPTFPSKYLPLGWPLDQIMVTGDLGVASFDVLEHNGSDHRAITGTFCLDEQIIRITK